jgi:hypothetical protein
MTDLKYRLVSVTSENPQYPASNLIESFDGWES